MKEKSDEGFVKASSENLPKIDLEMLMEFMSNSDFKSCEMKNVKTARSMRPNYGNVAIGYVQLKRHGDICTIEAQICPEHKTNSKNYNVQVIVDEVNECVQKAQCKDCAASQGGCKHAIAVVAWIHRKTEEPAPTSVQCYWRRPSLSRVGSNIKYLTIKDMLAGKRSNSDEKSRNDVDSSDKSFLRKIHHDERAKNTSCHLFRFYYHTLIQKMTLHYQSLAFVGDRNNAEEFLEFYKEILTPENCMHANKMTVNQSNSVSWFHLRYGRLTASIIMAAAKCQTLDGSLVENILSTMDYDSPAMKRGRELESEVLKLVGDVLMKKYNESAVKKCGLLLNRQYPALGASPDGLTENAVIEIKCPTKEKTKKNYYDLDGIRPKYKAQIQLQMLFAGKSKGYFCVADPKFEKNRHITIIIEKYDKEFTMKVIKVAMDFWDRAVFPHLMKT
ncbi:hypothetical protein QAD02_020361 [Eretmocerus hayati]|uniref:Uncharacterized protein n=1 Tax=Eretmocerus hayati TaxID=131215 RepID=A0ACC2PMP6_9HYME|nr:hypothetical protein QAD02_020361 [Eretmocerus hayati]